MTVGADLATHGQDAPRLDVVSAGELRRVSACAVRRGLLVERRPDLTIRVTAKDQAGVAASRRDVQIEHDTLPLQPDFRERARLSCQGP
jgi:hypothetical protein